jgi:hypothetical protein
MNREEENAAHKAARIQVSKEIFVNALREIPSGPARVRDSRLRKLAAHYRLELENCTDEIPCDLTRWGFRGSMTFDDFIYEALGRS